MQTPRAPSARRLVPPPPWSLRAAAALVVGSALLLAALFRDAAAEAPPAPGTRPAPGTQPADAPAYPPSVAPWARFVRSLHPEWSCPRGESADGTPRCVWPGLLRYTAEGADTVFALYVQTFAPGEAELPAHGGGAAPADLRAVDMRGRPSGATFRGRDDGRVVASLPAGEHVITGRLRGVSAAAGVAVPPGVGVVTLIGPRGTPVPAVREEGSVREISSSDRSADSVTWSVYRRLRDGSPFVVDTVLRVRSSGSSRSASLGAVVPPGTVPVSVAADLPVSLTRDGALSVEVRPGTFDVRVSSASAQPVTSLSAPPAAPGGPAEEFWTFVADTSYRSVRLSGGKPVSPGDLELPARWAGDVLLAVPAGGGVAFEQSRRGAGAPGADAVRVTHEIWPALDGGGFTAVDRVGGVVPRSDRLDLRPGLTLTRAEAGGRDRLVTTSPSGATGVEIRETDPRLTAVVTGDDVSTLPVDWWSVPADENTFHLNLPPAWELLGVAGAPAAPGSWRDSWSLFDLFVAMLTVSVAARIFGAPAGAVALVAVVAAHGQFLAPRTLFVFLLLTTALVGILRPGSPAARAGRNALVVTAAAWLLQNLAFLKLQFTQLLFPQLTAGTRLRTVIQDAAVAADTNYFVWPAVLLLAVGPPIAGGFVGTGKGPVGRAVRWLLCFVVGTALLVTLAGLVTAPSFYRQEYRVDRPAASEEAASARTLSRAVTPPPTDVAASDESAPPAAGSAEASRLLVPGAAVPDWSWRTYSFSVPGPAEPGAALRVYLLPPWAVRAATAVRIIAVALLLVVVIGRVVRKLRETAPAAALALAGLAVAACLAARPSAAEDGQDAASSARISQDRVLPDRGLLQRIEAAEEARLCPPDRCASVTSYAVGASGGRFRFAADVSSSANAYVVMPGPVSSAAPDVVTVDGEETRVVRTSRDGYLEVRVPPGRHTVEASGPVPEAGEAVAVRFPRRPLSVTAAPGADWVVEGVQPDGSVRDVVRLVRRVAPKEGASPRQEVLPAWASVTRRLSVGETTTVVTEVRRIGDDRSRLVVTVPLLAGERVLTPGVRTDDGGAHGEVPPGSASATFESTVPTGDVELPGSAGPEAGVTWVVICGENYSCTAEGPPPTGYADDAGIRLTEWRPFPDETVRIRPVRLSSVAGHPVTVDRVAHDVLRLPGRNEGTVSIDVRSTSQGSLPVTLPEGSLRRSVTLDGRSEADGAESDRELSLLVGPGKHRAVITYSSPAGPGVVRPIPEVTLGVPSTNVHVSLRPADDRWLLWTFGPRWGPAVLFWPKLVVLALICLVLVSGKLLPLGKPSAVFLAVGLASLPTYWIPVPLVWLAVTGGSPAVREHLARARARAPGETFVVLLLLSAGAAAAFYHVVHTGLVLEPPVLVAGGRSTAGLLRWYVDAVGGSLPTPGTVSLPMWVWRTLSFTWAAWLVAALSVWVPRAVATFREAP